MSDVEHINTEGVTLAGEIDTRVLRQAQVEEDYRNAAIASAVRVLGEVSTFAQAIIAGAGPYDDVRALHVLLVWVADKIREESNAQHSE